MKTKKEEIIEELIRRIDLMQNEIDNILPRLNWLLQIEGKERFEKELEEQSSGDKK